MPTTVAEWARTERLRRKWTQDEAVAELRRRTGYSLSRVWLSHIENGQAPSEAALAAMRQLYDSTPPADDEDVQGQLVAAMRAQAAAFDRLTERIDALLGADAKRAAARAEADVAAFLDAGHPSSEPQLPRPIRQARTTART